MRDELDRASDPADPAEAAGSLWVATAGAATPRPRLRGELRAEVAIVGGGFTGLSAAIYLAEPGRDVVLLEGRSVGWGASGRNGGQVIAGFKHDPAEICRRFGPSLGRRMLNFASGAPDRVWSLIDRYGIACEEVRTGWLQPAPDALAIDGQAARAREWAEHGVRLEPLDRDGIARRLGGTAYPGGLFDPRGGALHPLHYARGLAGAAERAGVRLFEGSPATGLERAGGGWELGTATGLVRAERVLLCGNAYTDALWPGLKRDYLPARSVQVATATLSDEVAKSILPERQAASDARRLLVYFRMDAQGRFLIGGRGGFSRAGAAQQQARLRRVALRLYPQLGDAAWEHAWGGLVALTEDHLPHLHEPAPGLLTAGGYNGRGVALATSMGAVLADKASGVPDPELDLPVTPLDPIPLHGLRRPALRLMIGWSAILDRLGR